jgi:glutamyl/glutaminyl-tRNA synthetase
MLKQVQHFKKTRIAPTPSGFLHLGNALSFALTAALARKTGAKILLRIDDLDRDRINPLYVQDIFDTLNFLEIPWDEGPRDITDYQSNWSQLQRLDDYNKALQQLKEQGNVFACRCSRAQLQGSVYPGTCRDENIPLDAPDVSWRLYTDDKELTINTLNNGAVTTILPDAMKDFIVRKKDGYPAYQLASLIDDINFGVDLVVRGQDLYPSTIAQHYLADVLELDAFKNITFHHHLLLMESAEKKLSKSAGATSIKYLREQGKTEKDIYMEIGKMLKIDDVRNFEGFERLL